MCRTFLQKRAASILMTVKQATSLHIVRKYTLPHQLFPVFWFKKWKFLIMKQGGAVKQPPAGKTLSKIRKWERRGESSEHTVSGTGSRKRRF